MPLSTYQRPRIHCETCRCASCSEPKLIAASRIRARRRYTPFAWFLGANLLIWVAAAVTYMRGAA